MKIFLSYALSDKYDVRNFKEQLGKLNERIEFLDHSLLESTEEQWKNNVTEKITKSNIVICLFGFSTWESEAVKWEVETAIQMNKEVLLVKLKSTVFMIPNYIGINNIRIFEEDVQGIANYISSYK